MMRQSKAVNDQWEEKVGSSPGSLRGGAVSMPTASPRAVFSLADAYRLHHDDLVRQAYLLVGSAEEAQDLVQDVFVRSHRHWDRVIEPAPYLRRAVVNACKSHHRRNFARRNRPQFPGSDGAVQVVTAGNELYDVLAGLAYRQRAAIVLHFYADLSERDIAAALGCRPGTVGSLIHRGLEQLRKVVEE